MLTSQEIQKLSQMSTEERVAYIAAKLEAKKAAKLKWVAQAFDSAFGI